MARAVDVASDRLAALEAGKLDPDLVLLMDVAEGIGVRPSAIIARTEAMMQRR